MRLTDPARYLTVPEFAKRAGMHPQTVRLRIADGTIRARQSMKNSPYKIPEGELSKIGEWVHA